MVCAVWRGNRHVKGKLTLAQYLSLQHILVASQGDPGGLVEQALGKLGVQRSIFCTVPHGLVAPAVVQGTDLALTLAEGVLRDQADRFELKLLQPPFDLPKVRLEMLWHRRTEGDVATQWLRALIISKARRAPRKVLRRP